MTGGKLENSQLKLNKTVLNNQWVKDERKREFKESFKKWRGFPGGAVVENLPANAGDTGSSPGLGRPHMPRSN